MQQAEHQRQDDGAKRVDVAQRIEAQAAFIGAVGSPK
jgi:hypothetical protein